MFTRLCVFVVLLLSLNLHAQENIGREIEPYFDGTKPQFAVELMHDPDNYYVLPEIVVRESDLANGPISSISYRLYDSAKNIFLTEWHSPSQNIPSSVPGTKVLYLFVGDYPTALTVLKSLKTLRFVIATNSQEATQNIYLGKFCKKYSDRFSDVTTGKHGCDVQP